MEKRKLPRVDETAELIEEEIDLDAAGYTWPDGSPMTEASTRDYTDEIATVARTGRPSLGGHVGASPSVAFRIPADLRVRAEEVAEREGRTVSAVAREALEDYVASHQK